MNIATVKIIQTCKVCGNNIFNNYVASVLLMLGKYICTYLDSVLLKLTHTYTHTRAHLYKSHPQKILLNKITYVCS